MYKSVKIRGVEVAKRKGRLNNYRENIYKSGKKNQRYVGGTVTVDEMPG